MTDPATPTATPYSAPGAPAAKSPVLSIISLIAGILGLLGSFTGWTLLFSLGGIILGHLGQKKEPNGKGMWITGLITGYLGALLNVVFLIAQIALIAALGAYSM